MTIRSSSQARAAKAKGRSWEQAVADHLTKHGWHAERRRLTGVEDCGDISGLPGVVIECKNEKRVDLAGWLDELLRERINADRRWPKDMPHIGAVLVRRRGTTDTKAAYVVMDFDELVWLLQSGGWGPKIASGGDRGEV